MIFLIDGNHMFHRALHVKTGLITSYGLPINAVYGCMSMIKNIVENYRDETQSFVICWDGGGKNWRHELYSKYKERRIGLSNDAYNQMKIIQLLYRILGIKQVKHVGCEGDDIIGTISQIALNQNFCVYIYSSDRDFFQLITENVMQIRPGMRGNNDECVNVDDIYRKFGVMPQYLIDIFALAGQKKDDIPGVEGVGNVTASKLIKQFKTVENLLNNLDDCKPKIREKLKNCEDQIKIAKKLVTIKRDLFDVFRFRMSMNSNFTLLEQMFKQYEFNSFLKNFEIWKSIFN